jgi:hypothetical protein
LPSQPSYASGDGARDQVGCPYSIQSFWYSSLHISRAIVHYGTVEMADSLPMAGSIVKEQTRAKAEQRRERIGAQERSGLSIKQFCQQRGLTL